MLRAMFSSRIYALGATVPPKKLVGAALSFFDYRSVPRRAYANGGATNLLIDQTAKMTSAVFDPRRGAKS